MKKYILLTLAVSLAMFASINSFALEKIVRANSLNGHWDGRDQNGRPCWIEISNAQYELDYNWTAPDRIDWTWTSVNGHTCTPYVGTMNVRMFFDGLLFNANVHQDYIETPIVVDGGSDAHGYAMDKFEYNTNNVTISIDMGVRDWERVSGGRGATSENFSEIVDNLSILWASFETSSTFNKTRECIMIDL